MKKKDVFGSIISCQMHDLIHDLACFVVHDESSIVEIDENICIPNGCRYSSIICHGSSSPTIVQVACEARKLRSFFLLCGNYCWMSHHKNLGRNDLLFSKEISNLTHLRALRLDSLSNINIDIIVGKLKHLRFLELQSLQVKALPDSITDLHNLQTLNLDRCFELIELPKGIKKMSNLRHLGIADCKKLTCMPCGLGRLTNLENQSRGTIAELQHLNQIKGELAIRRLDNVKDPKDAMVAKISSKTGLQSLVLEWGPSGEASQSLASSVSVQVEVDVLENLQPHPNLKHLEIRKYKGNRFPNWLTNMSLSSSPLPNLVEVSLRDLHACESLPPLGQLPFLKDLTLWNMLGLKKIGREFYGESASGATFPSLKSMLLEEIYNLEEWLVPEGDAFPSLETLRIRRCPKLTIQHCLPSSVVKLEIWESNQELLAAGGCLQGLSRLRKLLIDNTRASETGWRGLHYLTALEELEIVDCWDLFCLPEAVIQHHFSSLHTLQLRYNYHLQSLTGELDKQEQPPPLFQSLHHLCIIRCRRLWALPQWLRGIASLQSLKLQRCRYLQMLPDGLQHLAGFKELTISGCPVLESRCKRETGEDWHKIAHISDVQVFPEEYSSDISW